LSRGSARGEPHGDSKDERQPRCRRKCTCHGGNPLLLEAATHLPAGSVKIA